jgi:ABC-2 type transport system ATP-binding protein
MTPTISITGLSRRYRHHLALDDVTVDVDEQCIVGLLGANGAGKTTLLRIVAAQEFATAGQVTVFGASPVENDNVLRRMVFVREDQSYPDIKVRDAVRAASWFYPNWSGELADTLLASYDLPTDRAIKRLSRGMRTTLGIVIGLAARAEVTLFDEPYAGLDARGRQRFYDRLLADYAEAPRTIVLSTHLVDEVADLLERVVLLDRGRIMLDAATDDVRGAATSVTGPTAGVERFVANRPTWNRRSVAGQTTVVMAGRLDDRDRDLARHLQLHLDPVSLQQVTIHAAEGASRDWLPERSNA